MLATVTLRLTNARGSRVERIRLTRCRHAAVEAHLPSFDYPRIREEILGVWLQEESRRDNPNGSNRRQARYCNFTYQDGREAFSKPNAAWHWLDRELSSNLAGETGAVAIYRGALAALRLRPSSPANRKEEALDFCDEHAANESRHLRMFTNIMHRTKHTKLLPLWRVAGWSLGFFPTLFGGIPVLYVTVNGVETFVEEHFSEQIVRLREMKQAPELVRLLEHCRDDEVHHGEDATEKLLGCTKGGAAFEAWWAEPWSKLVKYGSRLAAHVARRI